MAERLYACLPACLPGSSTLRIVQPHHPTTVPGNFTSCSRSLASAVILLNLLLRISPHTIWHIVATTPAQAYLFVHYMMPTCMCNVYAVLGGFSVPRDILRYPAANTQNALERTIIPHCILLVAGRCVVCCVCNARANYVMFWQYTCGLL